MLMILASGPTELFVDTLCPQTNHIQTFRNYWHNRGVDIKRNGQVFNLRGIAQFGKSYEQIAKEYGR